MRILRPALLVILVLLGGAFNAPAQPPSQPQQETEYVPLKDAPPRPELPAERLIIAAYSFVFLAIFVYVLSLATRLGAVKGELSRLESEVKGSRRL